MKKLFIPTRLKVGFVKREDTYTKKLSYIIYYDSKGVLRKETSWENWRDKSIEPIEVNNTPHSGFILNKDVKRFSWSHYSSGRSMIRVYDDRGMEFEITPNNLLFILMNTNCFKRELEGEFVYAWDDKDLVLLPVGCEEYKTSTSFTQLQAGKVLSKDMVPGCVYKTKKEENLVYLGKFLWFDYSDKKNFFSEKRYVFINEAYVNTPLNSKRASIISTTSLSNLATRITDSHIDNLAEKLVELNNTIHVSPPVRLVTEEVTKELVELQGYYKRRVGIQKADQVFDIYTVGYDTIWNPTKKEYEYNGKGYYVDLITTLQLSNGKLSKGEDVYYSYSYYERDMNRQTYRSIEEIASKFVVVKVELANGLRINYYDY